MAITFIRIDDRIIHGQVVTRWAMENPCDGILAVNDEAANNPILKAALKSASTTKTIIYTYEQFINKLEQAITSDKKYFLITKEPIMLQKILENPLMKTIPLKNINVGPQSARSNTFNVNNNADITKSEIEAFEAIKQLGYTIDFRLVPDAKSIKWDNVRENLLKK